MTDLPTFTCDECGAVFPPDPDTMVETGFEAECDCESPELSPAHREDAKKEMGIDDTQLDTLLREGFLATGVACICKPCQDKHQ